MYYICRNYSSNKIKLPTDDLLEAVKISLNEEADLYIGNSLFISWMGYDMEENKIRLEDEGIEAYVVNRQYCFRYKDSKRNVKKIYYSLYLHDSLNAEIHLSDTPSKINQISFSSVEEIYSDIKSSNPQLSFLTVVDFSGDTFEGSYKYDLAANKRLEKVI